MAFKMDIVNSGLDPKIPVLVIEGYRTDLTIEAFFRSLRSEKTEEHPNKASVKLRWRTDNQSTPTKTYATVRIFIESLTQVYAVWYDPGLTDTEPGERHITKRAQWAFTGRLVERDKQFDPSPEADCIRVRGFLDCPSRGPEAIELLYLQVIDGSLVLPPSDGN